MTELGGNGVSLTELYGKGNSYIAQNPEWDEMAISGDVIVTCSDVCPCFNDNPEIPTTSDVLFNPLTLFIVVMVTSTLSLVSVLKRNGVADRWNRWRFQRLNDNNREDMFEDIR